MSIRSAIKAKRSDNTFTDRFTLSCLCVVQLDLWSLYGNRIPPFLPVYRFNFQVQVLDAAKSEIMKSLCVPNCRQEKKDVKILQVLCKKMEQERTKISGGASVTSPAACKTLLAACTFLATRQTKGKTQICWKLKFINSAVHRYLSEAIKAQQCFLPPFFQLIKFLPSHCASPEPQPVQYFVSDCNCFRGWKSKALEI